MLCSLLQETPGAVMRTITAVWAVAKSRKSFTVVPMLRSNKCVPFSKTLIYENKYMINQYPS